MLKRGLVAGLALAVAACGGGSSSVTGGGTVQGLQIPSNFSVVTPQGGGAQGAAAGRVSARAVHASAYNDAGTDFSTDARHIYVNDDSMQALGTINMILCLLDQTGASSMVNQGAYVALVDEDRCNQKKSGGAAQVGPTSGGTATTYARWTVDSTRADNNSPQHVHIWLPNPDGEMPNAHILVDMTVTEGVSSTSPFGKFRMNFVGVVDGASLGRTAGTEVPFMHGMLETVDNAAGQPQFRFVNLHGDMLDPTLQIGDGNEEAANVRLDDAAGSGGMGRTRQREVHTQGGGTQGSQSEYAVAYDVANFLAGRDDNADQVPDALACRARDQFDTHVWRYALYHELDGTFRGKAVTAGQRVALNSGFPFSFDSNQDGSNDAYGFVGYQGVWVESSQSVADGQAISRFDYRTNTSTPYTLRVSPGRLTRRSASQAPLSDFVGDQFSYWGPHPVYGGFGQWAVMVDANEDFQVVGAIVNGPNGPSTVATFDADNNPSTPPVSAAAPLALADGATISLWSNQVSGGLVYHHDAAVATASRVITLYQEESVNPGDAALFAGNGTVTLYCYQGCLVGGLSQVALNAAAGNEQALYHPYQGQPWTYTLSGASGRLTLTDDSNGLAVDASALDGSAVGHTWGMNTGQMLTAALADPSQPWTANDQVVGYRWETGANNWNHLVTAVDGQGAVANFDKPLQFNYVHATVNDANGDATYAGQRFQLNFGGDGGFGGLPSATDSSGRWIPLVNLADGVLLNDGANGFVVRALEMEQVMRQVALAQCAALDVSAVYADGTLNLPTSADLGTISFTLADQPAVTDAPAVIAGVVQSAPAAAAANGGSAAH